MPKAPVAPAVTAAPAAASDAPPAAPALLQEPPCSGNWRRDAAGQVHPADEPTATAAGLAWPTPKE